MIDANGGSAAFGHAQIEPEIMLQDVIKMVSLSLSLSLSHTHTHTLSLSLSLSLSRSNVRVTWVQPRVMDRESIQKQLVKLSDWMDKVEKTSVFLASEGVSTEIMA